MSGHGNISGYFGRLWQEQTSNGKTITYFTVEYSKTMGQNEVPQVRKIKAFSQKAIDKLQRIKPGSWVECRIELEGRETSDGKVYNDDKLDFDRIEVIGGEPAVNYRNDGQSSRRESEPPPMPRQEPQRPIEPARTEDGFEEDESIPF